MTYQFDGYNYIVRFDRGEKVVATLLSLAKEKNINGVWISGLGGAESAELGYYDLETKQYTWKAFDNVVEVTSLQGNIAWQDGEPVIHLHGTFTDREYRTLGGHVKEMITGGTCEIFLHSRFGDEKLQRAKDETSGLNLLAL